VGHPREGIASVGRSHRVAHQTTTPRSRQYRRVCGARQ
jgi:hypothetical protein